MPTAYTVADSAKLQVHHLPLSEKRALQALFDAPSAVEHSRPLEGGEFVARMGARRVLWRPDAEGRPVVLSVLDHSYARS